MLVRESRSSFLFYASGRRFCQNLTARMQLQQRQDLMSLAYYKFTPRDDYVDVEVHMNEASMPPLVRPDPVGNPWIISLVTLVSVPTGSQPRCFYPLKIRWPNTQGSGRWGIQRAALSLAILGAFPLPSPDRACCALRCWR